MDLSDVASRELNDGGQPPIGLIGRDQNLDSGGLGLCERRAEVSNLISRRLSPVRIGEVAICYKDGHFPKCRFDTDSSKGVLGATYFNTGRVLGIRDDVAM